MPSVRPPSPASPMLPDPGQELCLRAALLDGDAAREAWRTWKATVEIDRLDPTVVQVVPLLHYNLVRLGVDDELLRRFADEPKRVWITNKVLLRTLRDVLTLLRDAGLETLVLKGAALAQQYYRHDGLRPMTDVDVLVPETDFHRAAAALMDAQWTPHKHNPAFFNPNFAHAIEFSDARGCVVDLHCHLLHASCEPGADIAFWRAAVPMTVMGVTTKTLCATDHLLHACEHGSEFVPVRPIRWVADAMTILRTKTAAIDWDRLEQLATARGVSPDLATALSYLVERFDADVPAAVCHRLRAAPTTRYERRRARLQPMPHRGYPLRAIQRRWIRFVRRTRDESLGDTLRTVPALFRHWAQTDRWWLVPFRLIFKYFRNLGHRLGLTR